MIYNRSVNLDEILPATPIAAQDIFRRDVMTPILHTHCNPLNADRRRVDKRIGNRCRVTERFCSFNHFDMDFTGKRRLNGKRVSAIKQSINPPNGLTPSLNASRNRISGIDFSRYVVRIDVYNALPRQQNLGNCAFAATIRACENIQILAHDG